MSQWEHQAGTATMLPPRPPDAGHGSGRSTRPVEPPLSWPEIMPALSLAQQSALLELARDQDGVVLACQVPFPPTGGLARHAINHILAGQAIPYRLIDPILPNDSALDDAQRDALNRALATPDFLLVQGTPGTGKSRLVAELLHQFTQRGLRVLLVAPTPAPLDRAIALCGSKTSILFYRCLGKDERIDAIPPEVRGWTLPERQRLLREEILPRSQAAVRAAEERAALWDRDAPLRQQLLELAQDWGRLTSELANLDQQRATIDDVIDRVIAGEILDDPLAETLRRHAERQQTELSTREAERASRQAQRISLRQQQQELQSQRDAIHPLAEAKQSGRWWSGAWWKATFSGVQPEQAQSLDEAIALLASQFAALDEADQRQQAEMAEWASVFEAERSRLCANERERRHAAIEQQQMRLRADEATLAEKWHLTAQALSAETPRPSAPTVEAVREAMALGERLHAQAVQALDLARQWTAALDAQSVELPLRLARSAQVVAATVTSLIHDDLFGENHSPVPFDVLIVEDAHSVSEAEFLRVARRSRRWILLGEPPLRDTESTERTARNRSPRPAPLPLFQRLWEHLDSGGWCWENSRLVYRSRPLTAEQRSSLETEAVADSPLTELRILTPPKGLPCVAEVVFPPNLSLLEAKSYLFRELDWLAVRPSAAWHWCDEGAGWLRWSAALPSTVIRIEHAPGVRELLASPARDHGPCSLGVEFDCSRGWDRARAEAWLASHLPSIELGRAVRLETPHRAGPALRAALSRLFPSDLAPSPTTSWDSPGLIFVPVPADSARRRGASRPGGAGLEIDLSDARQRERIPPALRDELPEKGVVNLAEAEAIVRWLTPNTGQRIAVLAFFPAQVELIRRVGQASGLPWDDRLVVALPSAVAQREFDLVALSLTRSHTHRAVAFTGTEGGFRLALSRACSQVWIFGDAGTLARRTQWDGPLDHLDAATAARERDWTLRLSRCVTDSGRQLRVCRPRGRPAVNPEAAILPTGRTLAGWWRSLASYRPLHLWVGSLLLHRIDAPIYVAQPTSLDPLSRLVLRQLHDSPGQKASREDLARQGPLDAVLLLGLLRELEASELIHSREHCWTLTPLGQQALTHGHFSRRNLERFTATFVDNAPAEPHWLPLTTPLPLGVSSPKVDCLSLEPLRQCVERSPEWKQSHGFPESILSLPAWDESGPNSEARHPLPDARRLAIDRPERITVVVLTSACETGYLGFAVRPDGQTLEVSMPLFQLPAHDTTTLPELTSTPRADDWRPQWQTWLRTHGIHSDECAAAALEWREHRLTARVSVQTPDALRTVHTELSRGEVWLWGPEARLRGVAVLDIETEAVPSSDR